MKRFLCGWVVVVLLVGGAGKAKADYVFTTIDVPGSNNSEAFLLNNLGQIVGSYGTPHSVQGVHGFLWNGSGFTTLDVPGYDLTWANAINDAGQIVVRTFFGPNEFNAFLLRNGSYTPVGYGVDTNATGINTLGQIVGTYQTFGGAGAPSRGFLLSGGSYTIINIPNSLNFNTARGINDHSQIVGGAGFSGYLLDNGRVHYLTVPGSFYTEAEAINNVGQIVGQYEDGTGIHHSFLLADGVYSTIDFPGSTATYASGINDAGQIVGYYVDRMGNDHGFLATPVPEPSTLLLLAVSTLGVIGSVWGRRKVATRL